VADESCAPGAHVRRETGRTGLRSYNEISHPERRGEGREAGGAQEAANEAAFRRQQPRGSRALHPERDASRWGGNSTAFDIWHSKRQGVSTAYFHPSQFDRPSFQINLAISSSPRRLVAGASQRTRLPGSGESPQWACLVRRHTPQPPSFLSVVFNNVETHTDPVGRIKFACAGACTGNDDRAWRRSDTVREFLAMVLEIQTLMPAFFWFGCKIHPQCTGYCTREATERHVCPSFPHPPPHLIPRYSTSMLGPWYILFLTLHKCLLIALACAANSHRCCVAIASGSCSLQYIKEGAALTMNGHTQTIHRYKPVTW
jgi:hypothetical protein